MWRLRTIVLGSAAGGGYPQWNCRCPVCRLAWDKDSRVRPRTQAGIAVSADNERWILLNASPDLRAQLAATPALQPKSGVRGTPIVAVVLTGAEIDQIAGLLHLRERQALAIYATKETLDLVAANPVFRALAPDVVERRVVMLDTTFTVAGIDIALFAAPGKVPLYLEGGESQSGDGSGNTGAELAAGGRRLVFMPGAASLTADLTARLARAEAVMFDGTLFTDDEMIRNGSGTKTGRRMGHIPIDGDGGSLAALSALPGRRIYIHINNTNPILIDGSPERRRVEAVGVEIAEDGMEVVL